MPTFLGVPPANIRRFILESFTKVEPTKIWEFNSSEKTTSNLKLADTSLLYGIAISPNGEYMLLKNGNSQSSPMMKCPMSIPYDVSTIGECETLGTGNMFAVDGNHYYQNDLLKLWIFDADEPFKYRNSPKYKAADLYKTIPSEYGTYTQYNTTVYQPRFSTDGRYFSALISGSSAVYKNVIGVWGMSEPWNLDTIQFKTMTTNITMLCEGTMNFGYSNPVFYIAENGKNALFVQKSKIYRLDVETPFDFKNSICGAVVDISEITNGMTSSWYGCDYIEEKGILYLYSIQTGILQLQLS